MHSVDRGLGRNLVGRYVVRMKGEEQEKEEVNEVVWGWGWCLGWLEVVGVPHVKTTHSMLAL